MIDFSLENGRKSRCYQAFSDDRGRCKHYSSKITLSSSKSRNYIRDQKGILSQTIFMLSLPCLLSLRCVGMEEVPEVPDLSYTYAFAVSRNFNFFFFNFSVAATHRMSAKTVSNHYEMPSKKLKFLPGSLTNAKRESVT